MNTYAIILAAGKGTRMKSALPKVMHTISGIPMIEHIVRTLEELQVDEIFIVTGHEAELVEHHFASKNVTFVRQTEQLGTAHAVLQVAPYLQDKEGKTLILTGDTPLLSRATLEALCEHSHDADGVVLTTMQPDPFGYGRIIRDVHGQVTSIVEEKDATNEQRQITEVNTGIFCVNNTTLFSLLPTISNANNQSEYYLTDLVEVFAQHNQTFTSYTTSSAMEVMGINDRYQLSVAENYHQALLKKQHQLHGVTFIQPELSYIEVDVSIAPNVVIEPHVSLKGDTRVYEGAVIGSGSIVIDSTIGHRTQLIHSFVQETVVGDDTQIGPFAHLRPHSTIGDHVKIGNFVEVKKSTIASSSKVSHLSYIGDATVGEEVNIGCGSITVNYDGKDKHQTIIKDGAFIGCNVNLIAPVTIGEDSLVAAGSTITNDVPDRSLAIARERQTTKVNFHK